MKDDRSSVDAPSAASISTEGLELARAIETAAWSDLLTEAPAALRRELGLSVEHIGPATLLSAAGIPHPLVNRANLDVDDVELARELCARFRALGASRFFLQRERHPDPCVQVSQALADSGLEIYRRAWLRLIGAVKVDAGADEAREIPVRGARDSDADACAALLCSGLDVPPQADRLFAAAVGRPPWRVFVAEDPSQGIAGVGYLYVSGQIGYLGGAVTSRGLRGRGIQRALIAARIRAAAEVGCLWITSETGNSMPGEPQHSQRNMERCGLAVVGIRDNYSPIGVGWHGNAGA